MSLQADTALSQRLDAGVFARIASQMIDRLGADDVMSYGGWPTEFIRDFRPSRNLTIQSFRPQIESSTARAMPSDVVISIDYLSRVGMLNIVDTLDDLRRVTVRAGLFYVTIPEFADDVMTAGAVVKPLNWWIGEFAKRFDVHTFQRVPGGFYVIVYPQAEEVLH